MPRASESITEATVGDVGNASEEAPNLLENEEELMMLKLRLAVRRSFEDGMPCGSRGPMASIPPLARVHRSDDT